MFILRRYTDNNTKIYTVKIPRAHGSLHLVYGFKEQRFFSPEDQKKTNF